MFLASWVYQYPSPRLGCLRTGRALEFGKGGWVGLFLHIKLFPVRIMHGTWKWICWFSTREPRLILQCSVASPHLQGLPFRSLSGTSSLFWPLQLETLGSRIQWGESEGFMLLLFYQGAQAASPSHVMPGSKTGVADEGTERGAILFARGEYEYYWSPSGE